MAKNKKKGPLYKTYTIEKTLKHHVIEWSATVLSVAGAVVNGIKYIEGTVAGTIAGFLGAMIFVIPSWAFLGSLGAMVAEAIEIEMNKRHIDDNIFVPLVAGAIMLLLR